MFKCNRSIIVGTRFDRERLKEPGAFVLLAIWIFFGGLTNASAESAISYITVAKAREVNGNQDCYKTPDTLPNPINHTDLSAENEAEKAFLATAKRELTDHGIQVNWARYAAPNDGVFPISGCSYRQTLLYAFEIPVESLEQARTLGFKHWSEWPNPAFLPRSGSNISKGELIEPSPSKSLPPPFLVKSSGPLLCDNLGKAKPVSRVVWAEEVGKELVRAGIPVDYAFCAINPQHPPQGLCGEDSGKLDAFKIPPSSIPRALALGFQLAGEGVDGGLGALTETSCFDAQTTGTPSCLPPGVSETVLQATFANTRTFDMRLSGAPKNQAKLRNALGKAVAQGVLAAYVVSDVNEEQFSACVELTKDMPVARFDAFVKSIKPSKSKARSTLTVTERTTSCGLATTPP